MGEFKRPGNMKESGGCRVLPPASRLPQLAPYTKEWVRRCFCLDYTVEKFRRRKYVYIEIEKGNQRGGKRKRTRKTEARQHPPHVNKLGDPRQSN